MRLPSATSRRVLIVGAVLFGAFAIVAFTFRRTGVSQETLSIVGGVFATSTPLANDCGRCKNSVARSDTTVVSSGNRGGNVNSMLRC